MIVIRCGAPGPLIGPAEAPATLWVCDASEGSGVDSSSVLLSPSALSEPMAWNLGLKRASDDQLIFATALALPPVHARRRPLTKGDGWLACNRLSALEAGGFDEGLSAQDALDDLAVRLQPVAGTLGRRLGSLGPYSGPALAAKAPRLSIVIPTYRRPQHLADLLPRLIPQARRHGAEVIIVNDGSHDAAYDAAIADWVSDIVYAPLPENLGRGAATNHGVGLAGGAWIVFTDDDVWPPDDWLDTLAGLIADFPGLDAIGGDTRAIARRGPGLVERFTIDRETYLPGPQFTEGTVKCLVTACLAVKADLLRRVGALDPAFPCGQDHNLTWRLRTAGARIHATRAWWCGHDQKWTLKDLADRLGEYAYWHVRQAELSGDPIDVTANPATSWSGLLARLPDHLSWTWRRAGVPGRGLTTNLAYRLLDTVCFMAWHGGGIRAARTAGARAA